MSGPVLSLAALFLVLGAQVCAETGGEPRRTSVPVELYFDVSSWLSTGEGSWDIADIDGSPDVLSELEFKGLSSLVADVEAGVRLGRHGLVAGAGLGSITGGSYEDRDYLGDGRTSLFSYSSGEAANGDDDAVSYWFVEYRFRVFGPGLYHGKGAGGDASARKGPGLVERLGRLDVVVAYRRWRERLVITKGVQHRWYDRYDLGAIEGLDSRYAFEWTAAGAGLDAVVPLSTTVELLLRGLFYPDVSFEGEGTWNLRTDFRQDPSFRHEAGGGDGWELRGALTWRPRAPVVLTAGYRYWSRRAGDGVDTLYLVDGSTIRTRLNNVASSREGPFFSVAFRL
ncbi:MAG TPA: hypothetical protein ENJ37_00485 [Deltaproteobacteria bacterium]|nr:hypothetical protein [Deltaproteobacteria bacterium]